MQSYHIYNRLTGFGVFLTATIVYTLTLEPSSSFWDCPEFITSAARLEVGHPPGAPLFMLLGNLFSHLASDPSKIAWWINWMNALFSAACVTFLFWTITALLRKLLTPRQYEDRIQTATILTGGLIGALIYLFSDTFWYSAVEGEVYSCSSFFTALTFWSVLKWETYAPAPSADRWLIFIALLIGLSIGVHLLNLLCIPAIGLVIYYHLSSRPNGKGVSGVLILSALIVALVLFGLLPGMMRLAGKFELMAVNGLGLPYHTGTCLHFLLLLMILTLCIILSARNRRRLPTAAAALSGLLLTGMTLRESAATSWTITLTASILLGYLLHRGWHRAPATTWRILHTSACALLMLVIGYSTYAVILIRASDNPPMNQQAPDNPFALQSYLGREQYGEKPLLYGQTYISPLALKQEGNTLRYETKEGAPIYRRAQPADGHSRPRYVEIGRKTDYVYEPETCVWFPRMHDARYAAEYRWWAGEPTGRTISRYDPQTGSRQNVTIPSAGQHLRFLLRYQIGFMYVRYFLWNFVGRQNDQQGHGDSLKGNWLSGIDPIDRLAGHDPDSGAGTKGRNVYYAFPLLLGLIGLYWQRRQGAGGRRQSHIVGLLFFMTGLAIVLYLNDTPRQPRERDYVFAGSFYAFAIWTGMGAVALIRLLSRYLQGPKAWLAGSLVALAVPLQMAGQNWDDHDRSGRTLCRDMGANFRNSLQREGHPVLFVMGDNDTFPVWYGGEVEGIRPDVRACNLMYLSGGVYAAQMRLPVREAPPLPFTLPEQFCQDGILDFVRVNPSILVPGADGQPREVSLKTQIEAIYRQNPEKKPFGEDPFEWKNIVRYWLTSDDPAMRCIPTDEIHIPVDQETVARSGIPVPPGTTVPDTMVIRLKDRSHLIRTGLLLIDLIAGSQWERPLYVTITSGLNEYIDLSEHLIQEGLAYRIVPYEVKPTDLGMDLDRTYDCVMNRFEYGGLDNPDIYLDETNRNMGALLQNLQIVLAMELYRDEQTERARKVLEKSQKTIRCRELNNDDRHAQAQIAHLYRLIEQQENGQKEKEQNKRKETKI